MSHHAGEEPTTQDHGPLVAHLATRDVPCPACGYNLRGLTSDHCPECRHHVLLSVELAEPPIVPYTLAMVGLAACGAAFALLLFGVLWVSVMENNFPRRREVVVLLWVPAAIVAVDAAAVAWFLSPARRRWFRTQSRAGRYEVTLGCWLFSLAIFTAWLMLVFKYM